MKYYVSRHQRTLGTAVEADSPETAAKLAVKELSNILSGDELTIRWNVQMDPYSRTGEWLFADTTTLDVKESWIAAPSDQDLFSTAAPEEIVATAVADAEVEAAEEGGESATEEAGADDDAEVDEDEADVGDDGAEDVEVEASSEVVEDAGEAEDLDGEDEPDDADAAGDEAAGDAPV